jgi:hypothetical protein
LEEDVKNVLEKVAFQKMTSIHSFSLIEVEQLENKLLHYKRIIDFSNEVLFSLNFSFDL